MRHKLATIWLLLGGSILGGCSSLPSVPLPSMPWSAPQVQANATAEALFEEGMAHFNNKKYVLAIDRFQRVKAEFPFSPQLVPAELKLAEAYYLNKQYPEAAAAFKEFQTLHPSNENIPLVVYHLGLVHFDQFTSSDRYQKATEIARGYFDSVVRNHPNSPYAAPAKEKLVKCLEYLSEHEFNIATFYFNEKKYPAAIDRLEEILRRYRDTPIAVKALYYLAESHRLEKNPLKATLAYEALVQHYPNNPLAKTAQLQLSELSKEKQDPLALLLKQDGRLASVPPPGPEIRSPKSKIQNEKELNLVAKKEVVHEEPGENKGMLRRVGETLNPLSWFSSSDEKKEARNEKIAGAKKDESSGSSSSFWSRLNPFSAKEDDTKVDETRAPQLVHKIDESLKRKGIDTGTQDLASRPPASGLPKVEEAPPPLANTAELVGSIDAKLKKEGKNVAGLPPPPEPAPIFGASATDGRKPAVPTTAATSSPATSGLISGIDEALRRKGIAPSKTEAAGKGATPSSVGQGSTLSTPVASSREKIELAPKLPQEKGALFLDSSEYQAQEKAKEGEPREPVVVQPAKRVEQPAGLPQAVVKGPQTVKEKPAETKVAEKKAPDAEEQKGALEQLKDDLERLRNLLNPFGW